MAGSEAAVRLAMRLTDISTLARLDKIKQTLIDLDQSSTQVEYRRMSQRYAVRLERLTVGHKLRKVARDRLRLHYNNTLQGEELAAALSGLNWESQQDGMERRQLKRERDAAIAPFAEIVEKKVQQVQSLKQQYKTLSREWQAQMQAAYRVEYASAELCVPILYQDDALIVVDKPAGLLAVPGRRYHLQDSVLSRLRLQMPERSFLQAVHRLDRDTSGVMAIATSASSHAAFSEQFAQRQVYKTYEAVLSKPVTMLSGTIELPLRGDPDHRPRQVVNFQQGKPCRTDFKVLKQGDRPTVELVPHTGRTHQLRVHMAHAKGLNAPIVGDALYGTGIYSKRLHLHATVLELMHPVTRKWLHFASPSPF